jgi:hypothetical protein
MTEKNRSDFEKASSDQGSDNILLEFLSFLRHNKKWWLLPILLVLFLLGLLIVMGGGPAAPFIYTLF